MKLFNKILSIPMVIASILLIGSSAIAQAPLATEDFNLAAGTQLTAAGWTAHSGAGTNPLTVVSPGLTYSGFPGSGVGNAVGMVLSGEDAHKTFAVQSSGSVYAAFMVNVTDAALDPVGGYFFHLGPDPISTTFRGRVFIKRDASNNIAFGLSKALTAVADVVFTPFSYTVGTHLIVLKYTVVDGPTNDTVTMYVNPALPGGEPGTATLTATDVAQSDISPGSFALRQGATATSPTVAVDGIRIGTSWASVTTAAAPAAVKNDFDGDGRSDFGITRPATMAGLSSESNITLDRSSRFRFDPEKGGDLLGGPGTGREWWVHTSSNGGFINAGFGSGAGGEFFVPEDYDGDGKADIAVWRSVSATGPNAAFFYVLNSANSTLTVTDFGQANDNPSVVGDYDGDGRADPAVFRCSFPSTNGQCFYFYKGTNNNPGGAITYVPWGNNSAADLFPNRGDFDGDGKLDFMIQRPNPAQAGQGQFVLLRSSDFGVEYINWDTTSALIVPGDYDGDGRDDIMTVRVISGSLRWALQTRTGATSFINWGTTSVAGTTEFVAQSDYDGDGRTDIAVFRRDNTNPDNCFFYVLASGTTSLLAFEWGATTDTPINGWDVN